MRAIGTRRTTSTIAPIAQIAQGDSYDPGKVERAITAVTETVNQMLGGGAYVADVDLIVGQNTIEHGLGREPVMVYVAPSSASASFGWGWDPDQPGNPRPSAITHIVVTGVPVTARVVVE
jgi:hypothetical protein